MRVLLRTSLMRRAATATHTEEEGDNQDVRKTKNKTFCFLTFVVFNRCSAIKRVIVLNENINRAKRYVCFFVVAKKKFGFL
jgi:hypothetical protein